MRVHLLLIVCGLVLCPIGRAQEPAGPTQVELPGGEAVSLERLAAEHGLDAEVLKSILIRSRRSGSDALVIVKDGRTVFEEYSGAASRGPIEAMSATKSVVALAFGRLLADGRLDSLDAPVHRFYPEWNQGLKAKITIRHLLTQRSGLHCERITTEIYRSPDFVQFALAADVVEEPGTKWRYNNSGTNLLPGIVKKISGKRMDELLGEEVFAPLGITEWSWSLDRAGNPHGMAGLQICAADLAKIGQLMMDGGAWGPEKTRILPESFVAEATTHYAPLDPDRFKGTWEESVQRGGQGGQQRYGLLWWPEMDVQQTVSDRLIGEWKRLGAPEAFVQKMTAAKGLSFDQIMKYIPEHIGGEQDWLGATILAGRPDLDTTAEALIGYSARGYLGQYLIVIPRHRLVCVRMRIAPEKEDAKVDSFGGFLGLARRLGALQASPVGVTISSISLAAGCTVHVAIRNNTPDELRVSRFHLMSNLMHLELKLDDQSFRLRHNPGLLVSPPPLETDFVRIPAGAEVSLHIDLPVLGLDPTPPGGARVLHARFEGAAYCVDSDLTNERYIPVRCDGPVEVR